MYSQTYCNKVYNMQVIFESNYFKEITRNWIRLLLNIYAHHYFTIFIIIHWGITVNPKVRK